MKTKKYKSVEDFGKALGISPERIAISKMKAVLTKKIIQEVEARHLTAAECAQFACLSRTVISGIINGSLQSVSLERLLRLASALDLSIELKIKRAA